MAYVTITKDLTEVKDKVAFGLTRRQIICFSPGGLLGAGGYFLTRRTLGNDAALLLLIALAAPFMLLDIKLKGESGIDILQRIVKEYKGMKTILATAYSAYQDDFSTWSADGYWVKSQDTDSLKEEVKKVLAKES